MSVLPLPPKFSKEVLFRHFIPLCLKSEEVFLVRETGNMVLKASRPVCFKLFNMLKNDFDKIVVLEVSRGFSFVRFNRSALDPDYYLSFSYDIGTLVGSRDYLKVVGKDWNIGFKFVIKFNIETAFDREVLRMILEVLDVDVKKEYWVYSNLSDRETFLTKLKKRLEDKGLDTQSITVGTMSHKYLLRFLSGDFIRRLLSGGD